MHWGWLTAVAILSGLATIRLGFFVADSVIPRLRCRTCAKWQLRQARRGLLREGQCHACFLLELEAETVRRMDHIRDVRRRLWHTTDPRARQPERPYHRITDIDGIEWLLFENQTYQFDDALGWIVYPAGSMSRRLLDPVWEVEESF